MRVRPDETLPLSEQWGAAGRGDALAGSRPTTVFSPEPDRVMPGGVLFAEDRASALQTRCSLRHPNLVWCVIDILTFPGRRNPTPDSLYLPFSPLHFSLDTPTDLW